MSVKPEIQMNGGRINSVLLYLSHGSIKKHLTVAGVCKLMNITGYTKNFI